MSRVLPILFNTDMVRAILDGRKTVTRRLIKVPPYYPHFYKLHDNTDGALSGTRDRLYAGFYKDEQIFFIDGEKHVDAVYYQAPYHPGDILYVRETWCILPVDYLGILNQQGVYYYKADGDKRPKCFRKWRPSIHMPKEAARIWLKVKDVRVERLLDIDDSGSYSEGAGHADWIYQNGARRCEFAKLWNSTIKKSDLDRYGWDANPWVWVIEFERCEKPDGWCV